METRGENFTVKIQLNLSAKVSFTAITAGSNEYINDWKSESLLTKLRAFQEQNFKEDSHLGLEEGQVAGEGTGVALLGEGARVFAGEETSIGDRTIDTRDSSDSIILP